MAKRITAREFLSSRQGEASQFAEDRGVDRWTTMTYDLQKQADDFGSYLNSGKYTTADTEKYRSSANKAVEDLTAEMGRYGKNTQQYKTLDSYRQYYQDSLGTFDRLDVGTKMQDYINDYDTWRTQEDYDLQKQSLRASLAALDAEMEKIEDKNSADYKNLQSWRDWYASYEDGLNRRAEQDGRFDDVDDYTAYKNSTDYKHVADVKNTYSTKLDEIKAIDPRVVDMDTKQLQKYIKSLESDYVGLQAYGGSLEDVQALGDKITKLNELVANNDLDNLKAMQTEIQRLDQYGAENIQWNYGGAYDPSFDYQAKIDELNAALEKAKDDPVKSEEISAQIRALAGPNGDGTNANGLYDENTWYGRYVMENFDLEAAQKRIDEIDKELEDLGLPKERWLGQLIAGGQLSEGEVGYNPDGTVEVGAESDPHVMELRREKTELTQKMNSSERQQGRSKIETSKEKLSPERLAELTEAGKSQIDATGKFYSSEEGTKSLGVLRDLAKEFGDSETDKYYAARAQEILDMVYAAIGAEKLGVDIGYTADEALKAYEAQINNIAGYRRAAEVNRTESDFVRWNRQVFGQGGLVGGAISNIQNLPDMFTDEYRPESRTQSMIAHTGEMMGDQYDKLVLPGGKNLAQTIHEAAVTTGNMLPGMALSAAVTALAGPAGLGLQATQAAIAGKIAGAFEMGLTSGGQSYQQMLGMGYDAADARAYGAAMGAAEVGTQYLLGGITKLGGVTEEMALNLTKRIGNGILRAAAETAIHDVSEISEELLQNRIEGYLQYSLFDQGNAPKFFEMTEDDWYTVVVTALSTTAMEGPGVAIDSYRNNQLGLLASGQKTYSEAKTKGLMSAKLNKQEKARRALASEIGKAMQSDEALSYTLKTIGSSMEEGTAAYELATGMESGKVPANARNLGELFGAILSETTTEDGKHLDYDKFMAQTIGGAIKFNEIKRAEQAEGDTEKALNDAGQTLAEVKKNNPGAAVLNKTASALSTQFGADPVKAVETAAVINKIRNGTAISSREMEQITGNSAEAKAARAYLAQQAGGENISVTADAAVTEAMVNELIKTNREQKKLVAEQTKAEVLAAATEAGNAAEVNRAAAGATTKITAEDVKALQGAKRGVQEAERAAEIAKTRKQTVNDMSFEQMSERAEAAREAARLLDEGVDPEKLPETLERALLTPADAKMVEDLRSQNAELQKTIDGLSAVKMPSRAQASQLASARQQLAENKARVDSILKSAAEDLKKRSAEIEKAEAESKKAEEKTEEKPKKKGKKGIPPKQKKGDKDTAIVKLGDTEIRMTREQFIADHDELSKEEANRQFDDMVAMTSGQELTEEKGEDINGRQQTADSDEARNDLGEQRDRAEDSERGDQPGQSSVGENAPGRTRVLAAADGKAAASVTESAVEVSGENAASLEGDYPGAEKLVKYLMNNGAKRVVFVTNGQILNAKGAPVAGVYFNGEIFLNLGFKGGYHFSVTAEHELTHARLALIKNALGQNEARAFVASTLESIIGRDTFNDAFNKYWDAYGEVYMTAGLDQTEAGYTVCEEMLCDMVAGMNNFGAQLGIYEDAAKDYLNASKFDAVTQSLAKGENPTDLAYELPADNNMPYGMTFKELRPGDVKDAFKNEVDADVPPEQRPLPGDEPMHPELSLLSEQSLTEGTGLQLKYNDLGYPEAVIDPRTGERVTKVTADMMVNTPLGKLIQDAIIKTDDKGKVISGHITQNQADKEYQLLADAMNLITRYNDAPLVWEVVGSQLFSGVKKNSDTQYNYTIDFGTICRKTQAIVNVMSETMKYLGRGLSRREVEEVYLSVGKSGEATPCPVCYVFSRWMGIGGLLDQINRYQNEYFNINQNTGEFTWKVDKQQILSFMKEQEALAEQHVNDVLKDKQDAVDAAQAELDALSPNADEETRTKAEEKLAKAEKSLANKRKDFLDENGYLKYGGILSDMKDSSAIDGVIQKINQLYQGDQLNEELLTKMENASPEQQKKFRDIIKKNIQNKRATIKAYAPAELAAYDALAKEFNAVNRKNKIKKDNFTAEQQAELDAALLRATEAAKAGLDEALAAARAENDPVEKYQWLAKTVLSLKPGENGERNWEFNEDYKPVKQAVLFDLNKGADFARDYPLTWGFRTGKGCAMGKAIMPYSDARVGETLQGVVSSKGLRVLSDKMLEGKSEEEQKALRSQYGIMSGGLNPFLNGEELQRTDVVTRARAWARRQNLIGGMRYQSTSDFRFEWGSDYLITFFELQAIGANVQLYTKVIEAVDFLASTHSDCNLSVMPLGDGYKQVGTDENGEPIYELVYSSTTGIDKDAALEKVHQYDNVQLILVGINDLNIRLALASEDVTFVIPFHGSGQSVHQVQTLMDLLKEDLDVNKAKDYSDVQTDHFKKNRTAEEKAMWDLRMDIIMGNCLGGLTAKQQALIAKNKHLDKLYKMFYEQTENKAYHCFLAKEQAGQIFPYEYWDTTTTYATADRNGQIFQDYCESMGVIPRFSGKDSSGKDVGFGDFTKDKGYWKLLIDRKMYANAYDANGNWTGYGAYRDQEKVTTDNVEIGMLDENTVAEGKGNWSTSTAIPKGARTKPIRSELTHQIMMEAIEGTQNPNDKIQVTGIRNLEKAGLNEVDRTKMTKGFRERYLDAKSELRKVPKENIPVYALAMTDPGYKTSKREAPVTDGKQKLYVAPSSDAWAVARDTDGSLLNTDYIKNVLGLDIYDNPKDEHVVEERGSAGGGVGHLTAVTSTVPSYRQAFQYLKDKFPNAQNMRVLDASSGQGLGTAYGRDPAAAGKDAERKLAEAEAKLSKFQNKTAGKVLSKKEADTLKSLRSAVSKAKEVLAEIHKLAGPDFDNSDVSFNVTDLEPYNDPSHKVDFKKYGGLIAAIDAGEEEPFDFVISNAVMNVIAQDAREELMAALLRMTKPGGQIFINPADTGASDGALTLQQFHSAKEAGQDISGKKVLLVPKSENIGPETYVAKTKTIQKAFKPKEFQAFARDVAKQALGEDIEIVAGGTEGTGAINKGFIITRLGPSESQSLYSVQLTPKQQKNLDDNNKQTETGSKLKTLQGSTIQRYQNNVGKPLDIAPGEKQVYVHKNYADRVVPADVLTNAKKVLGEKYPNFQYNTIMYNTKTNAVRFDEAPNFDTAREPIPGGMITVSPNRDTKVDYSDNIWHHKWMWVDNDYEGFGKDGVRKSWEWSRQWLNSLREVPVEEHKFESKASQRSIANGVTRGPSGWNEQLEYIGLPTDPASDVEIKDKKAEIARIEGKQTKPVIPAKNAPKNQSRNSIQNEAPALKPTGENTTIYIKDGHRSDGSTVDFINEILDGNKKYETRSHKRLTRKWVGMAKDGMVYGRVKLGDPIVLRKGTKAYRESMIEGTEYDIKDGETKYAYPIEAVEDYRDNPKPVTKNGNYGRFSIQGEPATAQQAQTYYSQQDAKVNDWAPEFYSKMQRTIEDWTGGNGKPMGAKMAANQVLSWLKGKGVKAEEIKWSGIIPYLEGKKTVTKDELLQVMAENEIKIETKVLEDTATGYEFWSEMDLELVRTDNLEELLEAARRQAEEQGLDPENVVVGDNGDGTYDAYDDDSGDVLIHAEPSAGRNTHWSEYKLNNIGGYNYREILFKMPDLGYTNRAMRVHWGSEDQDGAKAEGKDVIAHARVQDTFTPNPKLGGKSGLGDGLPTIFVEEIQSDLHNAGTTKQTPENTRGFTREHAAPGFADKLQREYQRYMDLMDRRDLTPAEQSRLDWITEQLAPERLTPAREAYTQAMDQRRTFDADLDQVVAEIKERTKEFQQLGLIRGKDKEIRDWVTASNPRGAFRYADESFLDSLMDGSVHESYKFPEELVTRIEGIRAAYQASRDASEDLIAANRSLSMAPPDVPFAGSSDTYHEYVMKHLLRLAAEGGYDRLAWTTAQQQSDRWSDEYAEGYKIEYDQNIPKFMNKYVKQWGGKVGTTTLDNGDEVWSVDITPEMRDSVLTKGQPLFSIQDDSSIDSLYPEGTLQRDILDVLQTEGSEGLTAWVNEQKAKHEDALENAKIKAPAIPSKGFVPPVSAKERALQRSTLEALINRYGTMKPSEKSNGFVLPPKNQKGQPLRRHIQNVLSSENISEEARDHGLRFTLTNANATFVPDSNDALIKDAVADIKDMGLEHALTTFKHNAAKVNLGTKGILQNIALGEQLLLETSSNGDMANFVDVLSSVCELGTTIGKSLQAFRLLKQSGPIGQLYYVQKAVDRLNKQNEERMKRKGEFKEIIVKDDLAKAVINAKTEEERDDAMKALIADIASQTPATFFDRWNAWRYLAMLGNARTHVRNIVGNAFFAPLRYVKDVLAAGGEFLATKAGLLEEEDRTKALSVSRELRDFAAEDAEIMRQELQGNGKYNPTQEILKARRLLPGFLDALSRKNGDLLELEDWWFLKGAYARALAMQLSHMGYTTEQLTTTTEGQEALNRARKNAILEAQKATYRDFVAAASWLNRGKHLTGAAGTIMSIGLEGVLPFTKTPINILRRGVEYSPLGIAKGIGTVLSGVKNGNLDVAEAIDQLAAGLTGTGVAVLGLLLARMGVLRGKKGDDDEENFDKMMGMQDYSLQLGDQSFTIDWAAPTALPLFTGAAVAQLLEESDGELSLKDAWNAIIMIAEPMTSLSMLDGLNKLIESTAYASGNEKIATIASQAATSYLGQAFPTILGQVARSIDGTRRSTYVDKNSPIPAAGQRFIQTSVQGKIPGWENAKVPYIDPWGRQSEPSSKVLNGIENFFAPWYRSVKQVTDVDEELKDLYSKTKADILPSVPQKYFSIGDNQKKYLTADEWVSYATDVGQTKYDLMTQMISDPRYLALTDAQKAKVIKEYVYKYSLAAGKFHVAPEYDIRKNGAVWIEEAEAAATDYERFERIWQQIEKTLKD